MVRGRFPFGLAIISIADSNGFSGSTKVRSQSSSSVNRERNTRTKFSLIFPKASKNVSLATKSISEMVDRSDSFAWIKSSFWEVMKSYLILISSYASIAIGLMGPILSSFSLCFCTISFRFSSLNSSNSESTRGFSAMRVSNSISNSTFSRSFIPAILRRTSLIWF